MKMLLGETQQFLEGADVDEVNASLVMRGAPAVAFPKDSTRSRFH